MTTGVINEQINLMLFYKSKVSFIYNFFSLSAKRDKFPRQIIAEGSHPARSKQAYHDGSAYSTDQPVDPRANA